jgi:hypothetical protein
MGDQPIARPLLIQVSNNIENKVDITMPRMDFEPKISVFEWANTFRALDHKGTCDWYSAHHSLEQYYIHSVYEIYERNA